MRPLLTGGIPKPLSLAVNLGAQVQQFWIYANGSMCMVALTPSPGPWAHCRYFWTVPHLHSRPTAALVGEGAVVTPAFESSGSLEVPRAWHLVTGNTWWGPGGFASQKSFSGTLDRAPSPCLNCLSMAIPVPAPSNTSVPASSQLLAPPFYTPDPDSVPVLDTVHSPALSLYPFILPILAPVPASALFFSLPFTMLLSLPCPSADPTTSLSTA